MEKGILSGLKLDRWYKVFVYTGLFLFVISLFLPIKGITNSELQLLSCRVISGYEKTFKRP